MSKTEQTAVREYLMWLRDPDALRDDTAIAELQTRIDQVDDER